MWCKKTGQALNHCKRTLVNPHVSLHPVLLLMKALKVPFQVKEMPELETKQSAFPFNWSLTKCFRSDPNMIFCRGVSIALCAQNHLQVLHTALYFSESRGKEAQGCIWLFLLKTTWQRELGGTTVVLFKSLHTPSEGDTGMRMHWDEVFTCWAMSSSKCTWIGILPQIRAGFGH